MYKPLKQKLGTIKKKKSKEKRWSVIGNHHVDNSEIVIKAIYFKLKYRLSCLNISDIFKNEGHEISGDAIARWVNVYVPIIEEVFTKRKKAVGDSWKMDETYMKVLGKWTYYYRAVDSKSKTVDYLLSRRRDHKSAYAFLERAIKNNGIPRIITIDGSHANKFAIRKYNEINKTNIEIRQNQYMNNLVEIDHGKLKMGLSITQ